MGVCAHCDEQPQDVGGDAPLAAPALLARFTTRPPAPAAAASTSTAPSLASPTGTWTSWSSCAAPASPDAEPLLHELSQLGVLSDLPRLEVGPAGVGPGLRGVRAVVPLATGAGGAVAVDLPADGGRAAAQLRGDRPDRRLLPQSVGDVDPVGHTQIPGRAGRRHHRIDRWCRLLPTVGTTAVAPLPAGPGVDTDRPAGFLVAVALLHEPGVFRALPAQLHRPLSRPVPTDLEVLCIP